MQVVVFWSQLQQRRHLVYHRQWPNGGVMCRSLVNSPTVVMDTFHAESLGLPCRKCNWIDEIK